MDIDKKLVTLSGFWLLRGWHGVGEGGLRTQFLNFFSRVSLYYDDAKGSTDKKIVTLSKFWLLRRSGGLSESVKKENL